METMGEPWAPLRAEARGVGGEACALVAGGPKMRQDPKEANSELTSAKKKQEGTKRKPNVNQGSPKGTQREQNGNRKGY